MMGVATWHAPRFRFDVASGRLDNHTDTPAPDETRAAVPGQPVRALGKEPSTESRYSPGPAQ